MCCPDSLQEHKIYPLSAGNAAWRWPSALSLLWRIVSAEENCFASSHLYFEGKPLCKSILGYKSPATLLQLQSVIPAPELCEDLLRSSVKLLKLYFVCPALLPSPPSTSTHLQSASQLVSCKLISTYFWGRPTCSNLEVKAFNNYTWICVNRKMVENEGPVKVHLICFFLSRALVCVDTKAEGNEVVRGTLPGRLPLSTQIHFIS